MPSESFGSGSFTWDVPAGVSEVEVIAEGGGAGSGDNSDVASGGDGGDGARIRATFSVTSGDQFTGAVGGGGGGASGTTGGAGGSNGGGDGASGNQYASAGGGGGGHTDVSLNGTLVVVGGGGGGGEGGQTSDGFGTDGSDGSPGEANEDGSSLTSGSNSGSNARGGGGGGYAGGGEMEGGGSYIAASANAELERTAGGGADGGSFGGDDGNSGSVTFSYVEPPAAPSNASQTVKGDDQIQVDGTESSSGGAYDNFIIEVSEDGGAWTHVASPASMPYTYAADTSVDEHQFRVAGENSQGTSDWTLTSTKSTAITTVSTSNPTAGGFDVSWDAADDATEYDVLLAEQSGSAEGDYEVDQTVSGGTTTAAVTGRENGEQYYVRAIARYPNADSLSTKEDDATTTVPAPTLDAIYDSGEDELTATYTLEDNSSDGDVLVELSPDNGASWPESTTVTDLSADSATITGLLDGVEYTARVARRTDHTSAASGTQTATTILPASTDLTVGTIDTTSIELEGWTVNADNGQQRVEYKPTSEPDWQTGPSGLDLSTSTATVTSLRTGEAYDLRVVVETADATTASTPVTAETTLPDEDQPVLGNGVEDEIAVDRGTATTNYGEVRVQTRETGASGWDAAAAGFDEQVLAYDELSTIVTGREDGEEYETRLRTETEHATGAWTDPVSIITKFPGATSVAVASKTSTSATVAGHDNADNETGFELEREERISGEWRDRRVVADRGPNAGTGTISITDDTASPSTEYRYRIRPYTEHTSAVSNWTDPVSTPGLDGTTSSPTGTHGWRVRVEHADGSIHRPRPVGSPRDQPTVNDLPSARVPIPRDEKWHAPGFEQADVKAWVDGQRLPVDELVDIEDQSDRMVLVLEPSVLRGRVQREVDQAEVHSVLEDVITQDAGLVANVDDPAASTRSDVEMASADLDVEFQQELPDYPFPSDDPRQVSGGRLTSQPCLQLVQAPDMEPGSFGGGSELGDPQGDTYVAGNAVRFDGINEARSASIQVPYDHPSGTTAAWRIRYDSENGTQEFSLKVDGTVVRSFEIGDDPIQLPSESPPYWFTQDLSGLDAGSHSISLEMGDNYDSNKDQIVLDCAGFIDDRYETVNVDGGTVQNGVLQGRTQYPEGLVAETRDSESIEQIVAGSLDSTWTSTAPWQAVAISNDQGSTWIEVYDSETVQGEFDSGSAQIRARFTLDSYDSGSGPVEYDSPTALDVYTLRASLNDTPLWINKALDGSAVSVLNEGADYGGFIWQLWWNPDIDGYQVDLTQPGQRTEELDPTITDYSTSKRMGDMRYGTAVVKGSNRPVSSERWTTTHGTAVDLYQDEILEGSEAVSDPNTGTQYERGSDYTMDYSSGAVTALASGDLEDATEYAISYRYRTKGSYTSPSADADALEKTFDFPGATDDRECGQLALNIIKDIQEPVWEVELTIDSLPPGQLLVDEIAWPIPTGSRTVEIRSVDAGPGEVTVTGRGRGLGEVVSELRGQVEAVSQRS